MWGNSDFDPLDFLFTLISWVPICRAGTLIKLGVVVLVNFPIRYVLLLLDGCGYDMHQTKYSNITGNDCSTTTCVLHISAHHL